MPKPLRGLHHVTAIASDPQITVDFYTRIMGLRFVKRTVNYDDPGRYHVYFGDDAGTPGTLISFLLWPQAGRGVPGIGETSATAFRVPPASVDYWEKRLAEAGVITHRSHRFKEETVSFSGPDGLRLELVGHPGSEAANLSRTSDVPPEHAIRGLFGVTVCESNFELVTAVLNVMGFEKVAVEGPRYRFAPTGDALGHRIDVLVPPQLGALIPPHVTGGHLGAGSVHHIAFRAADLASQLDWRTLLITASLDVTPVIDRVYFQSVYFREPGGILFEIATDLPGFTLDEPIESLGAGLKVPPWMEPKRARVERLLPPIQLSHRSREKADPIDPHGGQPLRSKGAALAQAQGAVILLHGRAASAEEILSLLGGMYDDRIAYLAPQAAGQRWYPYSFMAPIAENEPWLSSALAKVGTTVQLALDAGIPRKRILLCGFSQGACLSAEFAVRFPARYGGLVVLSGGLIGPPKTNPQGDLAGMPAWFSSRDPDPHVPWSRVLASAAQFTAMGAEVRTRQFSGRSYGVLPEEVDATRELILRLLQVPGPRV